MMEKSTLRKKLAIVGLNGVDAVNMSVVKQAVLRGISVAEAFDKLLVKSESVESTLFQADIVPVIEASKHLSKKQLKALELELVEELKMEGILDEVQDLLACDMFYETAGLSMRQYRSQPENYLLVREELRAEVLEDGILSMECLCLLWLFRETGILHDLFTASEQDEVYMKITDHIGKDPVVGELFEAELHRTGELFGIKYLKAKKNVFHNPYLQGINLAFPFLERRQAIFIDFIVLGTNVAGRRQAAIEYLQQRGHFVEEIKHQEETLLKIDNACYRIFPATKGVKIPIQGVSLIPFYA